MADSIDEEEENRLIGYLDMSKIGSEEEFWEEYWYKFKSKGSSKMGRKLKERIKEDYPELPRERPTVTYYKDGIRFRRQIVIVKGKHYTVHRNVKTGRFISL